MGIGGKVSGGAGNGGYLSGVSFLEGGGLVDANPIGDLHVVSFYLITFSAS